MKEVISMLEKEQREKLQKIEELKKKIEKEEERAAKLYEEEKKIKEKLKKIKEKRTRINARITPTRKKIRALEDELKRTEKALEALKGKPKKEKKPRTQKFSIVYVNEKGTVIDRDNFRSISAVAKALFEKTKDERFLKCADVDGLVKVYRKVTGRKEKESKTVIRFYLPVF